MRKEKPASNAGGQNQNTQTVTDNLTQNKRGHKVSFASADSCDPFRDLISDIQQYVLEAGYPEECFNKRTSNGLLLGLDDRRQILHPVSDGASDRDLPGQLSADMLHE